MVSRTNSRRFNPRTTDSTEVESVLWCPLAWSRSRDLSRISSLPVGEVFGKLHYGDQSQTPGRLSGPPTEGKQGSKSLILVDSAQLIPQPHIEVAFGECSAGHPGS